MTTLERLEVDVQEAEARLHDLLDVGNRLDEERRRLLFERQTTDISAVRLVAIKSRLEQIKVDLPQAERQIEEQARIAQRARNQANQAAARLAGARRALEAVENPQPGTDVSEFSPATRRQIATRARKAIKELT